LVNDFIDYNDKLGGFRSYLDLSDPYSWYPLNNRKFPRRIVCHVGPTNSGKTFNAIKRLKNSRSGVYCAPLRLLAAELHEKLNNEGNPCLLRTGEIIRDEKGNSISLEEFEDAIQNVPLYSCTSEMIKLDKSYDVAVIDEIQLMADDQRGWAFSQAFLGVDADEVRNS
jgi:ATP-dependent RNA helicase SUPV3L1/SUV3